MNNLKKLSQIRIPAGNSRHTLSVLQGGMYTSLVLNGYIICNLFGLSLLSKFISFYFFVVELIFSFQIVDSQHSASVLITLLPLRIGVAEIGG